MRIRILHPSSGVMDGVSLSKLDPGEMYDLERALGDFLIATGKAEFVPSSHPALVIPIDMGEPTGEHLVGGISIAQPLAEAADTPPRPRRRKAR